MQCKLLWIKASVNVMIYLAMLSRLFRVMKKYLICFQKNPILSASTKITDFTRCVMYDLNIANDVIIRDHRCCKMASTLSSNADI